MATARAAAPGAMSSPALASPLKEHRGQTGLEGVHRYSVSGLDLRSNRPLPGVARGLSTDGPPVEVLFTGPPVPPAGRDETWSPWHRSRVRSEGGSPLLELFRRPDGAVRFEYADGHRFQVDGEARRIDVVLPPPRSPGPGREGPEGPKRSGQGGHDAVGLAVLYLFGPVLGWVLRRRGAVTLHASAVTLDGRSVLFLGSAGAGKSTTAAAFALAGYPVSSDDTVALLPAWAGPERTPDQGEPSDPPWVLPDAPRLRLWPESAEHLFDSGACGLEPLVSDWEKLAFDLSGRTGDDGPRSAGQVAGQGEGRFEDRARPLGAVFVLEVVDPPVGNGPESAGGGAVVFEPLGPRDALLALLAHGTVSELLDPEMRRHELDLLATLVDRQADAVRFVRLTRVHGADPSAVRQRVLEELASGDSRA